MKEIIKLENLSKNYKKDFEKIKVLENINYTFELGKLYLISGKSGAGKSTMIQILGLLLTPTDGNIFINGKNITSLKEKEKAMIRNEKIGFIFQSYYLNPMMKAYENVMLPMYLNKNMTSKERKEKAYKLLKQLELEDRENHYPKELSGGEQQRVAIARALANNPDIILADEPTGSLDSETEENILTILKDLTKKGKCVIIVSHSKEVKKYADEVLILKNKKLVGEDNEK